MYPLSAMQQGLLFHSLLAPGSGVYSPHIVLELAGPIDVAPLRASWTDAIRDHAVLRSGFFWEQRDEPFQMVSREAQLPWVEQDWSGLAPAEQAQRLDDFIAASRSQPFDLHRPPLMRLTWIRLGRDRHTLIWAYHHLILDGWSAARVLEQVFARLVAMQRGLPLAAASTRGRFGDYIAWLKRQDGAADLQFWRAHLNLNEAAGTLPLPQAMATD
jgi:hypothetical protein